MSASGLNSKLGTGGGLFNNASGGTGVGSSIGGGLGSSGSGGGLFSNPSGGTGTGLFSGGSSAFSGLGKTGTGLFGGGTGTGTGTGMFGGTGTAGLQQKTIDYSAEELAIVISLISFMYKDESTFLRTPYYITSREGFKADAQKEQLVPKNIETEMARHIPPGMEVLIGRSSGFRGLAELFDKDKTKFKTLATQCAGDLEGLNAQNKDYEEKYYKKFEDALKKNRALQAKLLQVNSLVEQIAKQKMVADLNIPEEARARQLLNSSIMKPYEILPKMEDLRASLDTRTRESNQSENYFEEIAPALRLDKKQKLISVLGKMKEGLKEIMDMTDRNTRDFKKIMHAYQLKNY